MDCMFYFSDFATDRLKKFFDLLPVFKESSM